jgi:hypothetical protein
MLIPVRRSAIVTNWNASQHSYEEFRTLVIDELLARTCRNFDELQEKGQPSYSEAKRSMAASNSIPPD